MTSLLNRKLCSPQYLSAFDAINSGGKARLESWPTGQHLAKQGDYIRVFRAGAECSPIWQGPSSHESDAVDWVVIND